MVRMGEVDLKARRPFNFFVVTHLGAIVERQAAFQVSGEWGEQLLGADSKLFLGSRRGRSRSCVR